MSLGAGKKTINIPTEAMSLANPITFYKTSTGLYPNHTQVWWSMKRPPELGTDKPPKLYLEVFDPSLRYQVSTGNAPVSKGHFIMPAFQMDRSAASGVSGLEVETTNGIRPAAVAFYASRVFYAGVFTADFNTKIYFSPVIERPEQVSQCYQTADPTAEDIRDLLPSDGGVIVIPEVTKIIRMQPYGQGLFIFCDNGVWQISGSNGGFRANDYNVSKLSGTPTLSPLNFTDIEGVPVWWNRASINTIIPDQNGTLTVQSMTDKTIKTFFDTIPEQSKFYAKGTYDMLTRRVQWLYRSTVTDDPLEVFNYDRILVLDTRTGAFYPWSLPDTDKVVVKGLFSIAGVAVTQELQAVVADGQDVVVNGDSVVSTYEFRSVVDSKVKYVVNVNSDLDIPDVPDAVPIPNQNVVSNHQSVVSNGSQVIVVF